MPDGGMMCMGRACIHAQSQSHASLIWQQVLCTACVLHISVLHDAVAAYPCAVHRLLCSNEAHATEKHAQVQFIAGGGKLYLTAAQTQ
jgi:hypothetical protein